MMLLLLRVCAELLISSHANFYNIHTHPSCFHGCLLLQQRSHHHHLHRTAEAATATHHGCSCFAARSAATQFLLKKRDADAVVGLCLLKGQVGGREKLLAPSIHVPRASEEVWFAQWCK